MANSVESDEMAHNEPSHLDLHCLPKYLLWSAGMKGLNIQIPPYHANIKNHNKCI